VDRAEDSAANAGDSA